MIDSLIEGAAFKWIQFRFGLKASDFQVKFRNIFRYISLFMTRIADNFAFSFVLFLSFRSVLRTNFCSIFILCLDCCRLLSVMNINKNQSGPGATTITDNKVRFSAGCLLDPMTLTGKFAFSLFPFYPNQCRLLSGPP